MCVFGGMFTLLALVSTGLRVCVCVCRRCSLFCVCFFFVCEVPTLKFKTGLDSQNCRRNSQIDAVPPVYLPNLPLPFHFSFSVPTLAPSESHTTSFVDLAFCPYVRNTCLLSLIP